MAGVADSGPMTVQKYVYICFYILYIISIYKLISQLEYWSVRSFNVLGCSDFKIYALYVLVECKTCRKEHHRHRHVLARCSR